MLLEPSAPVCSAADDAAFMQMALSVARVGAAGGEVPIGAVVVRDGAIIGSAHNCPIRLNDPTAHAEILALRDAAQHAGNYRLPGTTVYVTAEPCLMCVGAMVHARVQCVVFGCPEPKAGALGSVSDVGWNPPGNHRFAVRQGVCADEARALLQFFFRARRGA